MPDYIEYKIEIKDAAAKDILIAQLADAGIGGFEETRDGLSAVVPESDNNLDQYEKIIEDNSFKYSKSIIIEINWNAQWEADFKPVRVGNFCLVRADFHSSDSSVLHEIIITPKMSFGTGHHATTHLMIEAMQGLNLSDKLVFDFGTGTGILAILAEKCGAQKIWAIDNDEWSISNAIENLNSNNCNKVLLFNDNKINIESPFDIILANINRNIILEHLASIQQHIVKNGVVLLSGLLAGDEEVIVAEAGRQNLRLQHKSEMNGWICLLMVRN